METRCREERDVPRENLAALHKLVAEFEAAEREELGTPQEASLLDAVFSRMPIPMTIWVASKTGLCVSRRVTGAASFAWSNNPTSGAPIEFVYTCPELRRTLVARLAAAAKGNPQSFLSGEEDDSTCVWTHLIPEVDGVMGISLDLSTGIGDLGPLRASDRPEGKASKSTLPPTRNGGSDPQGVSDVE